MQEIRTISGTNIQYILNKDKRKNSYIQIKNSQVIVKVPKNANDKYINSLVNERIDWIKEKLEKFNTSTKNLLYKEGSIIPVLGKKLTLHIHFSLNIKRVKIENKDGILSIFLPIENEKLSDEELKIRIKDIISKYYKDIAKEEVFPAMDYITKKVGLFPDKIIIKNLSATWGICSSKRYISINQNLMMFSRMAIEYVCLHEVCHLKYMNHSKEFWNMVESYMPEYKIAKKELKY